MICLLAEKGLKSGSSPNQLEERGQGFKGLFSKDFTKTFSSFLLALESCPSIIVNFFGDDPNYFIYHNLLFWSTLWRIKYFYTEHLTAFVGGAEIQKSCEKIQKRFFGMKNGN